MRTTIMQVPEQFAMLVATESIQLGIVPTQYIDQYIMPMITDEHKLLCMQIGGMI
jgi:hypothetical protein